MTVMQTRMHAGIDGEPKEGAIKTQWDDLKVVLAIARHGSPGKAARALGTTQPTVDRRLDALENGIGVKLLERTGRATTSLSRSPPPLAPDIRSRRSN